MVIESYCKGLISKKQLLIIKANNFSADKTLVRGEKVMIIGSLDLSLLLFRKELMESWIQAGFQVVAVARGEKVKKQLKEMGVGYYNIPIERTGLNPVRDLFIIYKIWRLISIEKPDYILLYTIKPVIYGSLAAMFFKKTKVFSMITGLGYVFMEESYSGRIANFDEGVRSTTNLSMNCKNPPIRKLSLHLLKHTVVSLYRLALKRNEKVLFQNPDDIDIFIHLKIVRLERVVEINGSGVNLEHFKQYPSGASEEDIKAITFLSIARLIEEKGIREYVAAARTIKRKYPQTKFILVGWSFEDNPSAISAKQLEEWRDEGVVNIFGETQDVRPYLASSSVYVLSSYREGTPRTVLEAMAMGRPIITSDVPGCRETVINGVNGFLVEARNIVDLANAMEKFINNPELIKNMGKASRQIAEEKYNVHKVNQVINKAMGLDIV